MFIEITLKDDGVKHLVCIGSIRSICTNQFGSCIITLKDEDLWGNLKLETEESYDHIKILLMSIGAYRKPGAYQGAIENLNNG